MESDKSIYGIIGNPIEHSLSPAMHNAAFELMDVNATYEKFLLQEDELEGFIGDLRKEDSPIFGLNVTVPFKEKVLGMLDHLTPLAQKLKAVNTIFVTNDRKLTGYNTDAPGFMAHLSEFQFDTSDKRIAVLGAGGSARAIVGTLCMIPERPANIKIFNRTTSRIDSLLDSLGQDINLDIVEPVMSIDDLEIREADLLINTTSVGMHADDVCLVDEDVLHSQLLVYDIIYNPAETKLLKLAKTKGALTSNGLGMLFYQGVLSLQHWAEMELNEQVKAHMRLALEKAAAQLT